MKLVAAQELRRDMQNFCSVNNLPYVNHDVRMHMLYRRNDLAARNDREFKLLQQVSELLGQLDFLLAIDSLERQE